MIKLGQHNINNPIFLAPMAGITDLPTRRIMEKFGVGLSFSEMINAKNLNNASGDTVKKLQSLRNRHCKKLQSLRNQKEACHQRSTKGVTVKSNE